MNSVTLPTTGTYTMLVGDCSDTNTGNYNLSSQCFGACPSSPAGPALTSLSPSSALAGGSGFTLTVNGSNYVSSPNSTVYWNGSSRVTTYVSSTQLTAAVLASDITTAGTFPVTVLNPNPPVGASNAITFTVDNPVAAITSLSPSSVTAGASAFTLTVNGSNFVNGSVVDWNGSSRTTTYISSTQLQAAITTADVAAANSASVTVFNPSPGGGSSAASTFTISPLPSITSLSPSWATAGGAAFTLTISGANFASGAAAKWGTAALTTTTVNASQLTAAVPAALIASAGTASVTVVNLGGATSAAATFTVNPASVAVAKSIVLLVRSSADDTVTYFKNLLTSAGLPFTTLTASQVNAGSVANAIIIAGFSSEPTEFRSVAGVISTAVENGSWMLAEAYGAYLPAYAGIGSITTNGYYPLVLDHYYFVKPITASPLFNNIPTWDPPNAPDLSQQLDEYLVQTGSFTYVALTTVGQPINFWNLKETPGWPYLPTNSSYCQSWGGCTSQRSVSQGSLQVISQGTGEIVTGWNTLGVVAGVLQYGAVSDAVYKNFIAWASTLGGLQFYPLTPCRVADTRGFGFTGTQGPPYLAGGTSRNFPVVGFCGVPANATAYSLNVTVVPRTESLDYLTTWPAGQTMPNASTLNSWTGTAVANAALVPAGTNGDISIFASDDTDVLFDVNGYFAPPGTSELQFYPLTPCRVADTRGFGFTGTQGPPAMAAGTSRNFQVAGLCGVPFTAAAYSLNVTVVPQAGGVLDYLTAWPTGQAMPNASTLNSWTGTAVANAAMVPAGTNGDISIYVSDATNVLFDINGYFAPPGAGGLDYYAMTPCRVADTRGFGFAGQFGAPSMGAGTSRSFPVPLSVCSVPSTAEAYSLNVTVVPSTDSLDYLTTWPTGLAQPNASTLNSWTGTAVANAALVPAGTGGAISIFVSDPANVLFDINGYFAPGQ
jgi:hypothetical protein